ncbi:transcriptional regulator [Mergibacter septicus]|uniref:Transcriptional regulator n=1 Tax=Mergibacter septicus TaxID=221402 RepID=A0A8D4J0V1_9PAST|nr:ROK family transcriptional regulator [Mergibacter septicus]AWX15987.1 transcriptional regulator [Mergibacter septicus]QDJ15240.1 transcriptional regulator [Mergibacter septicus]UTU47342.1 ROK family transcriptional regulator [Mergibacter septicus]WMR95479.1 ROK family transcriptional regulator [Mergibacter septicus]
MTHYTLGKSNNSALLYRLIEQHSPISRIQLATLSQLAPASVTKVCRQLLAKKLIKEVEYQQSTGGRRAVSLVLEQQNWLTLLISLDHRRLTLAVMNLAGELLTHQQVVLQAFHSINELEQQLLAEIQAFYQEQVTLSQLFLASAFVVNGIVDEKNSIVYQLPNLSFANPWNPISALKKILSMPVYLGHYIRSLALAECYLGGAKACNDLLFLRIHHTRVGAGIVFNHQLLAGHQYTAGELGHIQVEPDGKPCLCGNIGCLETVVSNRAIEQQMQQILDNQGKLEPHSYSISNLYQDIEHNQNAKQLMNYVGEQLGKVLAMSVNLFNPEKIVISGEITQAAAVLFPAIKKALSCYALSNLAENTSIESSQLKNEEVIGGFALIKRALWEGDLLQQYCEKELNNKKV